MNKIRILLMAVMLGCVSQMAMSMNNNDMNNNDNTSGKDIKVLMKTTMGDVVMLLYGDTPRHLDNFVKLTDEGFYNGVLFHRVIRDFMIQTGDPESRNAVPGQRLGSSSPEYRIEAEFVYPRHFHKRGALAAAREGDATNPAKESSSSQFYIVTGRRFSPGQLDQMEQRMRMQAQKEAFDNLAALNRDTIMAMRRNRDQEGLTALQEKLVAESDSIVSRQTVGFTQEQREAYSTIGGAPHLDGAYTVFGEVIEGMDVIDHIQQVETDGADRPKEDVRLIEMRVLRD